MTHVKIEVVAGPPLLNLQTLFVSLPEQPLCTPALDRILIRPFFRQLSQVVIIMIKELRT